MRDTSPPTNRSGSSKLIVLFLIAGIFMLAAAGVVLFQRRTSGSPSAPPGPDPGATANVVAPLIASQPTRRPIVEETDTATDGEEIEKNQKNTKKSGRIRREKTGSIDAKQVNRFMNARFSQVKACYERRLKKNSFLEGKVDLNIDVASSGKVTRVSVNRDTVRDAEMLACVKRTIRAWQFPKPDGGRVIIGKTFNFKKKTT